MIFIPHINVIIAFILSFVISVIIINTVIKYSIRVGLGDKPTEKRKIHTKVTPNLGSLGVYIGTMVAYFAFSDYNYVIRPDKLFSIATLLFFMGMKDDLEPMLPKHRLITEFLCAFFIVYITDIRFITLWGIFGIESLPIWASYCLSALFIVTCINAYNLIDGIDGLLGSISLLGAVCFGFLFNFAQEWLWTLLCVALCGSLMGFLIFNWHKASVFMGNGGALFLGSIFACFSLHLMQYPGELWSQYVHVSMPHTIAFSIIAIPLVDLIYVFFSRIIQKKPPFLADNSHIHHRILELGCNHSQATLIILLMNILIIIFAYYIQETGALKSLIYTISFALFLNLLMTYILWQKNKLSHKKSKLVQ